MSPRCPGTLAPTIGTVISAPGLARVCLTNQRAVETALPLALAAGAGDQSRSVVVAEAATTTLTTQTLARYHWRRGLPVLAGVFSTPTVQLEVPHARRSHRRFVTIQPEGQVHRPGPAGEVAQQHPSRDSDLCPSDCAPINTWYRLDDRVGVGCPWVHGAGPPCGQHPPGGKVSEGFHRPPSRWPRAQDALAGFPTPNCASPGARLRPATFPFARLQHEASVSAPTEPRATSRQLTSGPATRRLR